MIGWTVSKIDKSLLYEGMDTFIDCKRHQSVRGGGKAYECYKNLPPQAAASFQAKIGRVKLTSRRGKLIAIVRTFLGD